MALVEPRSDHPDWHDPRWQAARLSQLVQHRLELMAEILKISMQCESAIEAGLIERLVTLLAEKDKVVDRLRDCQEELAPHAAVASQDRLWDPPEAREVCQRQIDQTAELQAAILAVDARCETAMVQRREQLRESLEQSQGANLAARAYAQHAQDNRLNSSAGGLPVSSDVREAREIEPSLGPQNGSQGAGTREGIGIDLTSG